MELTPMQKAANSLRALGRGEMISLALAYMESHMRACKIAGTEPPEHAAEGEVSDRISAMSDDELVAFLLPISALGHSD